MRQADLVGRAGQAWFMPRIENDPMIAAAIVKMPGVHMMWDRWIILCIHLREAPGANPPKLRFEGASHEFIFAALDPEKGPDIDEWTPGWLLRPFDLVHQVARLSDEQAVELLRTSVKCMITGEQCPPDRDFRSYWETALTSSALLLGQNLQ